MEFMTAVFANAEKACVFVKNEHSAVLCKKRWYFHRMLTRDVSKFGKAPKFLLLLNVERLYVKEATRIFVFPSHRTLLC